MFLRRLNFGILVLLSLFVLGCASTPPRSPLPPNLINEAGITGVSDARFWADAWPRYSAERLKNKTDEELSRTLPDTFQKPHYYLAISGGGAKGAFGAGLIYGWSETGTRPEFTMVTGISTGSLIAPFAFLGEEYDEQLKEVYTTTSTKDIVEETSYIGIFFKIIGGIFQGTISNVEPFQKTIAKYITPDVIEAIAEEHRDGRRLVVGTYNLDATRPVIWNIGQIAASDLDTKVELIHEILRASASIPIAFPPVLIPVQANGETYDELHVDGGVGAQVFVYPSSLNWAQITELLEVPEQPKVYVIRNSFLDPNYQSVDQKFVSIASKTVSSMIRSQGIGDLYRIYALCERDGNDFNLASIPSSFNEEQNEMFDSVYMGKLFDLGYEMARNGYPWEKYPPAYEVGHLQKENN